MMSEHNRFRFCYDLYGKQKHHAEIYLKKRVSELLAKENYTFKIIFTAASNDAFDPLKQDLLNYTPTKMKLIFSFCSFTARQVKRKKEFMKFVQELYDKLLTFFRLKVDLIQITINNKQQEFFSIEKGAYSYRDKLQTQQYLRMIAEE
jgi:hypothetical protein